MDRHSAWPVGLFCLSIIACGGTTTGSGSGAGSGSGSGTGKGSAVVSTLDYVSPCAPSTCTGSPAGDTSGAATCSSSAQGACGWSPGSPGADPNGTVSFRECKASECPAQMPEIACASGYDQSAPRCGAENDGPCAWITACTAHPTDEACAEGACGNAMPEIGVVCGDGGTGTLICGKTSAGTCGWQPKCP